MARLLYLSHPQVRIDPAQDVPSWSLSPKGAARVEALAARGALAGISRVVSSAEVKALETARPLAASLGCTVEIRPRMHENDRSATGFLPPAEFEAVADRFFAEPQTSVRGWETAAAAQARTLSEVAACLSDETCGDVLFVGHGGVGTLLLCALLGVPISRAYDQGPGGGNVFAFRWQPRQALSRWQPMETLTAPSAASQEAPA
ncbi:histidine phosphatase family protein [Salipiger marinus]|uniref:Broad specificity phosphatase PhoE n=1 Tax=Salipiger marinus TaxID=555512 RepID=A0A1G8IPE7_9RHOB|nr:histidine phosphatase family protein [Salipiger marinus]SDI20667.1 Broad specificity phosphatase PhoE [Salipiger marinus]